ncbi:hypothetical protein [Comamonas sp.]|uniref:hypothetical protein n=1 Tax=Comamonas sp. TaxID=34028 RepID=UPI003A8DE136
MDFWNWITQLFTPRPGNGVGAGLGRSDGSHFSMTTSYSRDDGSDVFGDSYFNNDKHSDKGCDSASADSDQCSDSGDAGGGSDGGGGD